MSRTDHEQATGASPAPDRGHWLRDLLLLTLLLGLYLGFQMGQRAIWNPDEGRYSEIPREMVVSGNYVTPHLDGVKYFEKPPLFYWLQAASIKVFGLHQWDLRLWPVLFALFGSLMVYGAGRQMFGRRAGLLSAMVLATSLLYYFLGRAIILDMAVSILMAAAMLTFLLGVRGPPGPTRRNYLWAFYVFMALATLTKGLIGIALPGLVILVWMALLNEWRLLRSIYLPSGLLIYLVVATPWHVLVSIANPEFPYFYFIQQQFLRYLTMSAHRYQPDWFFIPILLLGMVPWTVFMFQAVWKGLPESWGRRKEHKETLFLVLWAVLIFVFFSLSKSKLVPYILPIFPALALLIGRWLAQQPAAGAVRRPLAVLALLGLAGAVAIAMLPNGLARSHSALEFNRMVGTSQIYLMAVVLAVASIVPYLLARRARLDVALVSMAVLFGGFHTVVGHALTGLDPKWSVRAMAEMIKPELKPDDAVVTYNTYFQELPVYLQRRVIIVNWKNELTFGSKYQDTSGWMIDTAQFWKLWNSDRKVYVFANAGDYEQLVEGAHGRYRVLARNAYHVLLTNQPAGAGQH
ncbi:MAG: glycosyltransferase family 39 protein [Gammaproteobacteria bacterium]|jgi:4-amino-4-deoxy-L-arabinose transferase-like glycosyltransferase